MGGAQLQLLKALKDWGASPDEAGRRLGALWPALGGAACSGCQTCTLMPHGYALLGWVVLRQPGLCIQLLLL